MQSEPGETCILTKTHPKKEKRKKVKLCSYILLLKLIIWKGGKYVSYDGIDQKNLNEGESGSFSCS